ncbi:cation transporter [Pararhizobium sp. IMCC21322]|uniref:cation transporter n=1 Tax=Pararhizobium sp. IMCC21322 TaxID=3067903 RepID=UPI002741E2CC|nr:cation transporter [Pararhizobium sp. IMCC21322]
MKLTTSALALIGFMTASPVFAAEQTVTFSVPGMYCASCPFIVEAAMGGVEGVIKVTADSKSRTAQVVFDDAIAGVEDIGIASSSAGYEAKLLGSGS